MFNPLNFRDAALLQAASGGQPPAYFETGFGGTTPFRHAPFASAGMQVPSAAVKTIQYVRHRVPVLFKLANGNWCAMWQGMLGTQDAEGVSILAAVSTDKCKTFGSPVLVYQYAGYDATHWLNFGAAGCDSNGRVHVLFCKFSGTKPTPTTITQHYVYTDDLSLASGWSTEEDISASVNPDAYDWFIFGPSKIIEVQGGPQAGYLVAGADKRDAIGGTSFALLVYSDDGGATWSRGGRADEADSNNNNSNETDVCEIGTSGRIYMNSRINNDRNRRHAVVTDVTADPITMTFATDGSQNLDGFNCAGSVCSAPNGDLYFAYPDANGANERARLTAFLSQDAKLPATTNPTFPFSRVLCYPKGGYSSIGYLGGDELACLHERNVDTEKDTSIGTQFICLSRFSKPWLIKSLAEIPDTVEFHFNDMPAGSNLPQVDATVRDHGTHHNPAQGNGTTAGAVTFDTNGIVLANSPGIVLQTDQNLSANETKGGIWDWLAESFTLVLRVRVDANDGADRVLFDNRNSVTTAAGFTLAVLTATGSLRLSWNDGTAGNQTITNTLQVEGSGHFHNVYVIRDRAAGAMRLLVDADPASGTQDDGAFAEPTPVADASGSVLGVFGVKLGSQVNGSLPFDGRISYLKYIKGQPASELRAWGDVHKVDPLILAGNAITVPAQPTSYADCVLALGQTWDGGVVGADFWGARTLGRMPPVAGSGLMAMRDRLNDEALFRQVSEGRSCWWEHDANAGWMVYMFGTGTSSSYFRRVSNATGSALPSTAYDFVQNTGIWSLSMVFAPLVGGTTMAIAATHNGGGTDPGFLLARNTSNSLFLTISQDASRLVAATFGPTLTPGVPYYLGLSCAGPGNPVRAYVGAFGAGLIAPSLGAPSTTGNMGTPSGTHASVRPFCLGVEGAEVNYQAHMRFKNFLLFNTDIGAAEHQSWANYAIAADPAGP